VVLVKDDLRLHGSGFEDAPKKVRVASQYLHHKMVIDHSHRKRPPFGVPA
jgi:hypothetical protein